MDLHHVLISTVTMAAIGFFCIMVSTRLGLGSLIGFLVTGVIIGPYTKGFVLTHDVESMRSFSELGVVLLLFLIGLEMQPKKLWTMRRDILGLGAAQMLACAAAIGLLFLGFGAEWRGALVVSLTLAMSSTAFVMQILADGKQADTPHGRAGFSILLFQDLAIVPLMALTQALSPLRADTPQEDAAWVLLIKCGALAGLYFFGRYALPAVLRMAARYRSDDATLGAVFFAVLGSAMLTEGMGLSMALGAFLIGVALSTSDFHFQVAAVVRPYKQVAMALFFIAVGMSIDVGAAQEYPSALVFMVPATLILKTAATWFVCRRFGHSQATATRTALLLSQAGEFGFVMAAAATQSGIINAEGRLIVFLTIALSMAATPLLSRLADRLAARLEKGQEPGPAEPETPQALSGQVLVAGFGLVGRVVCSALKQAGIPYLALDTNPRAVDQGTQSGFPVLCADAANEAVLATAVEGGARSLVITYSAADDIAQAAVAWRMVSPEGGLAAICGTLAQARAFQAQFDAVAIPRAEHCGLLLARIALDQGGAEKKESEALLEGLRRQFQTTPGTAAG